MNGYLFPFLYKNLFKTFVLLLKLQVIIWNILNNTLFYFHFLGLLQTKTKVFLHKIAPQTGRNAEGRGETMKLFCLILSKNEYIEIVINRRNEGKEEILFIHYTINAF